MKPQNKIIKELNEKQKQFCREYIYDWNASRAYRSVYKVSEAISRQAGQRLLTNVYIKEYIEYIQKDLEKLSGISRLKVINEFSKLAFNSIASLHDTWITRKDFDELTEDQRACISEISTKIQQRTVDGKIINIEYVNIKLHDKNKALENINKMLGYNAPEKHEIKTDVFDVSLKID